MKLSESNGAQTARRLNWARWLGWTVVPLCLMLLWELAASRAGRSSVFPRPSEVGEALVHPMRVLFVSQGSLLSNTVISLLRVGIGFAVAAFAGVALGLLMGSSRIVRGLFEPIIELVRPLCPIAWLPFAIAVFGLTRLPQLFGHRYTFTILDQIQVGTLFVLFWGAFFPVFINTLDGVAGVRRNYITLARMLGANRLRTFLQVNLPAAMPNILTGLRQGIAVCWFVIIAAEMLPGSDSGIGYLLMFASDLSDMKIVIAAMVIIGGIGALLNLILVMSMRRLVRWHGKET